MHISTRLLMLAAVAASAAPAAAGERDDWTGVYAGVHGGYDRIDTEADVTLGGAWSTQPQALRDFVAENMATSQKDDDFNMGLQLGYNHQFGSIVVGAEAAITSFHSDETVTTGPIRQTPTATTSYTFTNTVKPDAMATLKAKVGFTTGSTLFYADGGLALTRVRFGSSITSSANYLKDGSITDEVDGYVVGGGIEQRFSEHLSARIGYNYADMKDLSYTTTYRTGSALTNPAYTETVTQDLRMHLVQVGVNYRF